MSQLESRAMLFLWKQRTCCVHMVQVELEKEKRLAYTTVQTIMDRLVTKGFAKKHQLDKTAVYTPMITKPAYATSLVTTLIQQLSTNYPDEIVTALLKGLTLLEQKQLSKITSKLSTLHKK